MMRRIATITLVTAIVVLSATAAGFALSYSPTRDPRADDLPHMTTVKPSAPTTYTATARQTSVPPTPALTKRPVAKPQAPTSNPVRRTAPVPAKSRDEDSHESSHDHEVVTPPVHDSDDGEHKSEDEKKH